jgi:hypothetical protein
MELSEIQQRMKIASDIFPIGKIVCNTKIGSIGVVKSLPYFDSSLKKIFLIIEDCDSSRFLEDIDCLVSPYK